MFGILQLRLGIISFDAHTKRLKTKRPTEKTSQGTKRPKGHNVPVTKRPRDKTSQGPKRPNGTNEAHYLTWCGQLFYPI